MSEFAIFLWRNKEPDGANTSEEWLKEIWLAFSKSPNAEALIFEFIACLAINCATHPTVFFGILNNAMLKIPFVNRRRLTYFQDTAVAANTMSRLSREGYSFWPKLAQDWLEHRILNDRLASLGFFDRNNFDYFTPVKSPDKHQSKKSRKARSKAKRRAKKKHLKFMPRRPSFLPRTK